MPQRNYLFYNTTNSLCPHCLRKIEAKIIFRDDNVYMIKHCPEHGRQEVLIADDIEYYKKTHDFIKPGDMPLRFNTKIEKGCPFDCGLCPDHEQHGCLTLVEITDQCNMECPVCYADSDASKEHRSLAQIEQMLDNIVANEGEPQIVQISGGEPTIHPDFFAVLDMARSKPIKHIMVNTNGMVIAKDKEFARRLAQYKGIEIYLQFDSLKENPLKVLRGADMRAIREQAIANLNEYNINTTLVVVLQKGLNDNEIGDIIEYALKQKCVRGISFQPVQIAGRLEDFDPAKDRYTLTEVRKAILSQNKRFQPNDILPVPCHPDALAMAYALKFGDRIVPLTSMLDPETYVKIIPNTVLFEQNAEVKKKIFDLFSLSQSPQSSATSLQQLLCCLPVMPVPDEIKYENVFRIMIMQFQDPYNFDVRSVKRSCVHIAHPDGRIMPFDTYNIFYRG